ncbi:MAG: 2-oxo acid dehydrogenase subunit E2 [Chloroflexi bacterium]|nr:2-oxo acid dehydrogenase subunit E2 [Chloroflexota bacterium]
MATTIKMPQLGESVTEGTIERWLVKEGDTVEQYDPLFEVVTDKVNAEVPAEIAGTVSKILVPDGETVAVGTPVAEIDADGADDADAADAPTAEPSAADAPAAEGSAPEPAQPEAAADAVPAAVEEQESAPAAAEAAPEPAPEPKPEPAAAPTEAPAPEGPTAEDGGDGASRMTPAVRRLVREHDIDVAQLTGTGAGGRVTRDDVLSFIDKKPAAAPSAAPPPPAQAAAPAGAPVAPAAETAPAQPQAAAPAPSQPPASVPSAQAGDTEVPLSQMRKGIARKMTQVKQTVPHAYTVVEVDMTSVVRWREANNMAFKAREGASLSYVAVVVKAVTETLRKHPNLNSQFADDKIILRQAMNIGIAVAVDNGLIVPVIANADQLSISGVNARIRDISSRANGGKLRLDELQGGTFTVNNTGWFGSVVSMPIINAPEVAILSMEAIVKRPRVMEVDGEDVIAIRHMMNMTCSFDHRVLDGAQVGFFLADVRKALEEWDAGTPLG